MTPTHKCPACGSRAITVERCAHCPASPVTVPVTGYASTFDALIDNLPADGRAEALAQEHDDAAYRIQLWVNDVQAVADRPYSNERG